MWTFLLILDLIALLCAGFYLFSMKARRCPQNGFYSKYVLHYAHRGVHAIHAGIPENSIRAFRLAANNGYGAELDVRMSRDGNLVVMHDESLKRTTGANANVSAVTAQVLSQLTLEGTREKVPFLEDVLPLFNGKAPLLIELKPENGNHVQLTKKVMDLLDAYPDLSFMIESFDPRVLRWLRKHRPDVLRGQLAENFFRDEGCSLNWFLRFLMTNMMCNFLTRPDFVAYKYEDRDGLAPALCRRIWGPQFFWWVVRSQEDAKPLLHAKDLIIFEGFAAK